MEENVMESKEIENVKNFYALSDKHRKNEGYMHELNNIITMGKMLPGVLYNKIVDGTDTLESKDGQGDVLKRYEKARNTWLKTYKSLNKNKKAKADAMFSNETKYLGVFGIAIPTADSIASVDDIKKLVNDKIMKETINGKIFEKIKLDQNGSYSLEAQKQIDNITKYMSDEEVGYLYTTMANKKREMDLNNVSKLQTDEQKKAFAKKCDMEDINLQKMFAEAITKRTFKSKYKPKSDVYHVQRERALMENCQKYLGNKPLFDLPYREKHKDRIEEVNKVIEKKEKRYYRMDKLHQLYYGRQKKQMEKMKDRELISDKGLFLLKKNAFNHGINKVIRYGR